MNVKGLAGNFNKERALVGAFSVNHHHHTIPYHIIALLTWSVRGGAEHGGVVQPLLQHHHRHLRPRQRRGGVGAGQAAVRARVGGGGLGVELQTKVREDFIITEKPKNLYKCIKTLDSS